ncbi:hypothetical protein DNTS_027554 [Danionella cerebrum]|nr:hypothetical protein DNTS_027554 [Danionella translucida]
MALIQSLPVSTEHLAPAPSQSLQTDSRLHLGSLSDPVRNTGPHLDSCFHSGFISDHRFKQDSRVHQDNHLQSGPLSDTRLNQDSRLDPRLHSSSHLDPLSDPRLHSGPLSDPCVHQDYQLDSHLHPNLHSQPLMGPMGSVQNRGLFQEGLVPEMKSRTPSTRRRTTMGRTKVLGTRSYSHEDLIQDWREEGLRGVDCPPKLVPVSGQLERKIQQALIRPTAFKPVIPKSHSGSQFLSPRLGLSGSQGNLSTFANNYDDDDDDDDFSTPTLERRSSYSGKALQSQNESTRLSLTNLNMQSHEASKGPHTHSHSSDSGRSSSSKSTGSLGPGRSESGPAGGNLEALESLVRDLEEKLNHREMELQTLRENLDHNQQAICQV